MFFSQNAGSPAAGTGLKKSAIVQKISLADAAAAAGKKDAKAKVATVNATPAVINPNGACTSSWNHAVIWDAL